MSTGFRYMQGNPWRALLVARAQELPCFNITSSVVRLYLMVPVQLFPPTSSWTEVALVEDFILAASGSRICSGCECVLERYTASAAQFGTLCIDPAVRAWYVYGEKHNDGLSEK